MTRGSRGDGDWQSNREREHAGHPQQSCQQSCRQRASTVEHADLGLTFVECAEPRTDPSAEEEWPPMPAMMAMRTA